MVKISILLTMLADRKELKLDVANQKTALIHVKLMLAKATNVKITQPVCRQNMLDSLVIAKATKLQAGLEDIAKPKVPLILYNLYNIIYIIQITNEIGIHRFGHALPFENWLVLIRPNTNNTFLTAPLRLGTNFIHAEPLISLNESFTLLTSNWNSFWSESSTVIELF